jgi:hypothetical protein
MVKGEANEMPTANLIGSKIVARPEQWVEGEVIFRQASVRA